MTGFLCTWLLVPVGLVVVGCVVGLVLVRRPRRCPEPGCDSPVGFHEHVVAPPGDGPGVDAWARRG